MAMSKSKRQSDKLTGLSKACEFCRTRKIRCDSQKPSCGSCVGQNRDCVYKTRTAKERPTLAALLTLRQENEKLQEIIGSLKRPSQPESEPSPPARPSLPRADSVGSLIQLDAPQIQTAPLFVASEGINVSHPLVRHQSFPSASNDILLYTPQQTVNVPVSAPAFSPRVPLQQQTTVDLDAYNATSLASNHNHSSQPNPILNQSGNARQHQAPVSDVGQNEHSDSESDHDVSPFISVDEEGMVASYGPSSALQSSVPRISVSTSMLGSEHHRNGLIANAVLTRQKEHMLYCHPDLDGVPIELALHLLDLHWNRQHHTFLLTYRPAIMRDLMHGGPYASKFLLNAIFACSAKYSRRQEVQDVAGDTSTAGLRWFRRCDQLLDEEKLLLSSSIPTVIGLTLLASTYNARGEISKGWLFQGYAFRMAYDLGLHLDRVVTLENAEEVEIRRRVFWGVFICDKLQSLYLGRPMAMHLADAHVSRNFLDTMEEGELWTPYIDPTLPALKPELGFTSTPTRSVSCFEQLCSLSKIMERVMRNNYVIGATAEKAMKGLRRIDASLERWLENLPAHLQMMLSEHAIPPPPNLFNIHAIYHTLVVLLHRPIIAEGHLYAASSAASSLKRCTIAARAITLTMTKFYKSYGLRGAPYLFAYALYVACTIHVRNAAMFEQTTGKGEHCTLLATSLHHMEQICVPNPVVSRPITIIRKLMATKGINPIECDKQLSPTSYSQQFHQQLSTLPDALPNLNELPDLDFAATEAIANWLGDPQDPFRDDQLYGFMDVF